MIRRKSTRGSRPWWHLFDRRQILQSLDLLELPKPALSLLATALVFGLVVGSRLLALPASIWEQDEAYFASAVVDFAPAQNRPHPPWFPLWIALGKAGYAVGFSPPRALQLASLTLGVAVLFPLVALWSRWMPRSAAMCAAVVFLATPAAWLFAGRALTETGGTTFLVFMLLYLTREPLRPSDLIGASCAAGACLLIRPQLVPAVALGLAVASLMAKSTRRHVLLWGPLGLILGVGFGMVVILGGGAVNILGALRLHAGIHFGALPEVSYAFSSSGLARSLLSPGLAAAWLVLCALGILELLSVDRSRRRPATVLVAVLAGSLLSVYGVANPTHTRYFVPFLALSSGPVLLGLRRLGRPLAPLAATAFTVSIAWLVLPILPVYRAVEAPPLRALHFAVAQIGRTGGAIIADRRLASFVDYLRYVEGYPGVVIYDYQLQLGIRTPAPGSPIVLVYDENHEFATAGASRIETFGCSERILTRLSQARFLSVSVALHAEPRRTPAEWAAAGH